MLANATNKYLNELVDIFISTKDNHDYEKYIYILTELNDISTGFPLSKVEGDYIRYLKNQVQLVSREVQTILYSKNILNMVAFGDVYGSIYYMIGDKTIYERCKYEELQDRIKSIVVLHQINLGWSVVIDKVTRRKTLINNLI
jgi:hypothetical protein